MAQVGNWTEERSSTQGMGDITVNGALSGAGARLRDSLSAGPVWYSIANGDNREAGIGTFDGTDIIQRTTIDATWDAGIYNDASPSPINLVGPSVISCTFNSSAFRGFDIGNPPVDGYVLSSTVSGIRNWVNVATGGGASWGGILGDILNQADLQLQRRIQTRLSSTSTTLQLTDEGNAVKINNAGATNLTIDPVSTTNYPIGMQCIVVQGDVGQVSVIGAGGVTILAPLGKNKTAGADEVLTAYHELADTWRVMGGVA